jgi:hypothetical protein
MPVEQGPVDPDRDAERFATAIEQGRTPGSVADAGLARDLEIAAMLRSAGEAYAPRPDEKARARARLMAVLAQPQSEVIAPLGSPDPPVPDPSGDALTTVLPVVASDAPAVEVPEADGQPVRTGRRPGRHTLPRTMSSRPAGRPRGEARSAARGLGRRALVLGAAALVAVVAAAGGSVFASRDALPGDALYAVKRVAESAGLAMTFDKTARAHRQLELATTRLDEIGELVSRSAGTAPEPELVQSAIQDFDASTGDGSRGLMDSENAGGAATLGDLSAWAGERAARLSVLRSALPTSTVAGADNSINLLDRLLGRTQALSDRSNCTQVTSGTVDDLGPLPASGTCSPRTAGTAGGGTEGGRTEGSSSIDPSKPDAGDGQDVPNVVPSTDDPGQGLGPGPGPGPGPEATNGADTPDTPDTPTGAPSSSSSSTTTTTTPSGGNINVPLPLLPPITLPPLLPGLPSITIG